jgi:hypothetical protein
MKYLRKIERKSKKRQDQESIIMGLGIIPF